MKNMPGMDYMGDGMAMGNGSFCMGGGMPMLNGFQNARGMNQCFLFLFPGAVVDSSIKYAFAVLGAFMLGVLNELLVISRNYVSTHFAGKANRTTRISLLSTVYGVQMINAYFCMLLAMVYEATMFSLIILGFFCGHIVYLIDREHRISSRQAVIPAAVQHVNTDDSVISANSSSNGAVPMPFSAATVWFLRQLTWWLPRTMWLILLIIVLVWDELVEGAFGTSDGRLFSWHSLCMTLAFPVCLTESILLFSSPFVAPTTAAGCATRSSFVTTVHVVLHCVSFVLALLGMIAVAFYKSLSGPIMFPMFTLFTPHAWLGMLVMVVWVLQMVTKTVSWLYCTSPWSKLLWKRLHVLFGHVIYVGALASCALGLQDMQSSDMATNAYGPRSRDAQLASAGCILLMVLGISVYLVPELKFLLAQNKNAEMRTNKADVELSPIEATQ